MPDGATFTLPRSSHARRPIVWIPLHGGDSRNAGEKNAMVPSLSRDCARAAAVVLLVATRGWGVPPDAEVADAARRQDRETVRALVAGGADTTARQPDGATALHWAVHWQDVEMAALLIKAGADVDAANDYGIVPLSLACSNGDAA